MEYDKISAELPEKKYRSWSKSVRTDNMTREICVKEAENGYIITKTISGDDSDGKWFHKEKVFISKENPLEVKKEDLLDSALDAIDNLM